MYLQTDQEFAIADLTDTEFDAIVVALSKLKERSEHSKRGESWQTAGELLSELPEKGIWGRRELDAALVERFLDDPGCDIRPAFYPHESTLERMWGHVDKVKKGPGRDKLKAILQKPSLDLEPDCLSTGTPLVFLSHTLTDLHFAGRVRLNLARNGVRCWMAEGNLHKDDNLFEAVEAALYRCDATVVLVSSLSINSAWVFSEIGDAMREGKEIIALIDASDSILCEFFKSWWTRNGSFEKSGQREEWLTGDGIELASAVLEKYMRVGEPTRILKFAKAMNETLGLLTLPRKVAFYPSPPPGWPYLAEMNSFDDAVELVHQIHKAQDSG